ncbi:MAG: proprotein convertase P-domain-containing protein [Ferruginibacter sp.]
MAQPCLTLQAMFFPASTNTIAVAGVPNGATVTGLSVRLSITHTYVSDLVIVLKAPNGQIFNLDAAASTSGKAGQILLTQ